jgi:hypothetical protein
LLIVVAAAYWRAELTTALAERQNEIGSWVNPADSFMEGDPNNVTSYGLLELSQARPQVRCGSKRRIDERLLLADAIRRTSGGARGFQPERS